MNFVELLPTTGKYLEIGPLDNPFLKRPEYDVYYMDYNTTEKVRELYENTYADLDKIVDIDYPTGGRSYKETVGEMRFTGVYSSHCIEHTHDLIGHLVDVSEILQEGGRYTLVVPDKSNCFDCFRAETTFREAYSVFLGGSINSFVVDSMFNFSPRTIQDDVKKYWNKEVSFIPELVSELPRIDTLKKIFESKEALSFSPGCHIWTFSYKSFLELIRDCLRFKLIPFSLEYHESTKNEDNYNMYIVLKKDSEILENDSKRLAEIIKIQTFIEDMEGIHNPVLDRIKSIEGKKEVFVYGAGYRGRQVYEFLRMYADCDMAFLVSDNQEVETDKLPAPVKKLSEITPSDTQVIVIATIQLGIYKEMCTNLKSAGFKEDYHYFRL